LGAPKTHVLLVPRAQARPTRFTPITGVQVPVQARTLSPQHCRPDFTMVLRPSQPNKYVTT
jgi:hypothetical protein